MSSTTGSIGRRRRDGRPASRDRVRRRRPPCRAGPGRARPGWTGRPPRRSRRRGRGRPAPAVRRAGRRGSRASSRSQARTTAGPGRRGDQADVGGVPGERRGERLLVPDALGGDHDGGRRRRIRGRGARSPTDDPLGAREGRRVGDRIEDRDAPAGGRAERDERTGDRASCRPPTGPAQADAVPRRSPAFPRNGRS